MKTITKIMIAVFMIAAIALVGCTKTPTIDTEPKVCSADAKECPDGSYVGRDADNNCEFKKCPAVQVNFQLGTFLEKTSFDPEKDIEVSNFKTEAELESFIKSYQNTNYYGNYYGGGIRREMLMMDSAGPMLKAAGMAETSDVQTNSNDGDFSETNNQVKGVDEGDIIKTDGEYIYTVSGRTLYIVEAYPAEDAKVVATIKFDTTPTGLFIEGEKLAVYGNIDNNEIYKTLDYAPRSGMTFLDIYDISNKKDPKKLKDYKFEGYVLEGRMKDGFAYIISVKQPYYRDPYPMPIIYRGDVMEKIAPGNIHYYNIPYNNPVFANINSINLKGDLNLNTESILVEGSQNLYMSNENIYITYTEYINEYEIIQKKTIEIVEPILSDSDKEYIAKIKQADDDILSQDEKLQKVMQVIETYVEYLPEKERDSLQEKIEEKSMEEIEKIDYFEFTVINKVSINEGKIKVKSTGKVPGHIMNQFSMDENGDVFRIATTVSQRWSQFDGDSTKSTNHIFTLDEDLDIIDSLDDLAEGEQIYSTRFMGDRLYMVTFRQVDPFFVIDLSDSKNIKELGQLKIPGFSRYLHPYDDNTIIGIGRDASLTGRQEGLKISLFDVTDVEKPKEVAKFVTDEKYASSKAEYEHKAFLFSKEKNMLVIPAYSYSWDGSYQGYNGAMVFSITKEEIELRGLIDHSQGSNQYYSSSVERSLYIKDMLYTKSPSLLRINAIDDLHSVKNVTLQYSDIDMKVY
jgi:uncharacterized secreted protein with C-terminal beta-propeller domain